MGKKINFVHPLSTFQVGLYLLPNTVTPSSRQLGYIYIMIRRYYYNALNATALHTCATVLMYYTYYTRVHTPKYKHKNTQTQKTDTHTQLRLLSRVSCWHKSSPRVRHTGPQTTRVFGTFHHGRFPFLDGRPLLRSGPLNGLTDRAGGVVQYL